MARAPDRATRDRRRDRRRRRPGTLSGGTDSGDVDVGRDELAARLGDPGLFVVDVRSVGEYTGRAGYPCDARQGHLPGARHLELGELLGSATLEDVRERVGLPEGAEIVAYCHSGSRSATAVSVLRAAGYRARNYGGSWHEWAADPSLPVETTD